jgi:choline-sulfatase
LWEKARFYEASARVPLIIRWPAQFQGGRIVTENVNLCDLYATMCDLADIAVPRGLDSRSLVPLMSGWTAGWLNESVSQLDTNHVMIKQDDLKYQYYGDDIPEVLFDLRLDPGELVNVAGDAEYQRHMGDFRRRLAELGHGPNADLHYVNAGYTQNDPHQANGEV